MKAYIVHDADSVEPYSEVVFAESVTEAKKTAMRTDACLNADYIGIRVRRCKALDDSYRGHSIMNWYDTLDRIDLVSKAGFYCDDPDRDDCAECCAKDECEDYQDYLQELEGELKMIIMTQKQFKDKIDRMMCEREERERFYRRFEELDRQICELQVQLHELKMKTNPEYRRQNTPTCGEAQTTCHG